MIRGIHHIALHARDLERMARFYEEGLGFARTGHRFDWKDSPFVDSVIGVSGSAARSLMLKGGNVYVELFQYDAPPARKAEPLRPQDRGYTHFAIDTDDIDGDYARLIAAGMRFVRDVPDEAGGVRSVYGTDPEGNLIELQQLVSNHGLAVCQVGDDDRRAPVSEGEH